MSGTGEQIEGRIEDEAGDWDVVVVGTGMGGAMAGRRLAERGLRVLFLEKGHPIETQTSVDDALQTDPEERVRLGRWPHRFSLSLDEERSDVYASLACTVGGSTQPYSAALERLEPHDVDDLPHAPHPTGGWPIRYDELVPYYEEAERLLFVQGTRDPLGPALPEAMHRPPPMRPADAVLMQDLAAAGLAPYRMHVGIAYKPGCRECLGAACMIGCKSDAKLCGIDPARAAGAELRVGADVVRIEADEARVTGVVYRQGGRLVRVRARAVLLAAGTYRSAPLLLASASERWPQGLANRSGLVGRNLMFHADDWVAVWPSRKASGEGPAKTIASRALYLHQGQRLGFIHATGLSAGYGNILLFLLQWFDASRLRWLTPLRPLLRVPALVASKLFGQATILCLLVEDLPYADNRVERDPDRPDGLAIHYRARDELWARTGAARRAFKAAMRGRKLFWLRRRPILNLGHPMGTLRFGDDPATSVLDRDCRAHGIDNLWVADGSFMPTGGGMNPSLTIAANALRVADAMARALSSERDQGWTAGDRGEAPLPLSKLR